jgi:hypothetical protein
MGLRLNNGDNAMATKTQPDLIKTEIIKNETNTHIDLVMHWNEKTMYFRQIQAETFGIAALICEASEFERWIVDPNIGGNNLRLGVVTTNIRIELVEGGQEEMARAATVLLAIEYDITHR